MAEKNPFAQMSMHIKQAIDHDLPIICGNEAVKCIYTLSVGMNQKI